MRPAVSVPVVLTVVMSLCATAGGAAPTSRPSRPTTVPVDKRKPYLHAPSGVAFPVNVGAFRRVNVYQLDQAGRDVIVGYSDPTIKIAATVSVHPTHGVPAERAFDIAKKELLRMHPKAAADYDGAWTLRQGEREFTGHRAAYQYVGRLGGVDQDLTTEAYLLVIRWNPIAGNAGEYFVDFRLTYPTVDAKAARLRIEGFTEWLELPAARSAPTSRPASARGRQPTTAPSR